MRPCATSRGLARTPYAHGTRHAKLHALLLRHGYRHTGAAHKRYLADLKLPTRRGTRPFLNLQAIHDGDERVARFTEALREQTEHWRSTPLVQAVMTLRGIDFVAVATIVAEVGDFSASRAGSHGIPRSDPCRTHQR